MRHPRMLAVFLVAVSCLGGRTSRADSTASADAPAASTPVTDDLRGRFSGVYRYAGDAREQKLRLDAIDRSVDAIFFVFRDIARSRIEDRTRIVPWCRFEFSGGEIRSTVPGHRVAVSPETGAPAPYRVDDDAIVLSQRFEEGRIVQVFTADEGGTRTNEFTMSADGKLLFVRATLSSPKLAVPVRYTLTYRRVE